MQPVIPYIIILTFLKMNKTSIATRYICVIMLASMVTELLNAESISTTTIQGRNVVVSALTPDIIRVENFAPDETPSATLPPMAQATPDCSVTTVGDMQLFTTSTGVTVRVNTVTGAVDITAGHDRSISDNGIREISDGQQSIRLSTMGSGSFYGAGERGYSFNLAGDTLVMYNKQNYGYTAGDPRIKQMNITMPLFLSSNGYAVVFDDYTAANMVMSNPIVYTTEAKEPVSYYFINSAGTLASLMPKLTTLTGHQPLPPLWSLGYITSKYGYRTQDETIGVVDTLKRSGYPLDGIVLDLYWYGKEQDMGRLSWEPSQWRDHRRMLSDLKKRGVNTVIISQPYILRNGKGLDNYNYLRDNGLLLKDSTGAPQEVTIWVGEGGMFDVSNPNTRKWLKERYRQLTLDGVGGWWGDLGEPEVHPESGLHANGLTTRQYHNKYGNDWSKIIYDLYKEEFPDRRLMTMMRGGTTGLQQYSVYPWSTDVSRSWGGLQPQITIMLNSGLSGLGYMSHDVGGFAIDESAPYDPELYVRWLQLGTFSPVLRTHAQRTAEPYNYPEQQHIILPLIKERYRWLPYNYTLAYENATDGLPLVRPLNFYSHGSAKYDDIADEYLWGRNVLVAPVLTKGTTKRRIIFPEGEWFDIANPETTYHEGDTISYAAPLETTPLFVRAGSFIPTADYPMDNTGDYRTDRYTINYYPAEWESSYTLYEDNPGSTSSLSDKEYRLVTFTGETTPSSINIKIKATGSYPQSKKTKKLSFVIHRTGFTPTSVTVDDRKIRNYKYDPTEKTLRFEITLDNDKETPSEIRVQ